MCSIHIEREMFLQTSIQRLRTNDSITCIKVHLYLLEKKSLKSHYKFNKLDNKNKMYKDCAFVNFVLYEYV